MSGPGPSLYDDYISRVNSVQDYINDNLDRELSLEELAGVACFSVFHFHRIFRSVVKEPLYQYILRLRLEKAAGELLYRKNKSVTDIAIECGFSDSAVFARSFKKRYGLSSSRFRTVNFKNPRDKSKNSKDLQDPIGYLHSGKGFSEKDYAPVKGPVEIVDVREFTAAYLRYTGPYKENPDSYKELIEKILQWALAGDLLGPDMKLFTIYHDNPEITEDDKQRTSVCLAVPEDTETQGAVGKMKIAGGKYAIGSFEISADGFPGAWNYMYGEWLPSSGYEADDRFSFELYKNDPNTHPQNKTKTDIYLPVRPL